MTFQDGKQVTARAAAVGMARRMVPDPHQDPKTGQATEQAAVQDPDRVTVVAPRVEDAIERRIRDNESFKKIDYELKGEQRDEEGFNR